MGSTQDEALKIQKEDKLKEKVPIDEDVGSHRMRRTMQGVASHTDKPNADDDMEAYRCLILEEPPPPHDS